jgi:hypothetical protein
MNATLPSGLSRWDIRSEGAYRDNMATRNCCRWHIVDRFAPCNPKYLAHTGIWNALAVRNRECRHRHQVIRYLQLFAHRQDKERSHTSSTVVEKIYIHDEVRESHLAARDINAQICRQGKNAPQNRSCCQQIISFGDPVLLAGCPFDVDISFGPISWAHSKLLSCSLT